MFLLLWGSRRATRRQKPFGFEEWVYPVGKGWRKCWSGARRSFALLAGVIIPAKRVAAPFVGAEPPQSRGASAKGLPPGSSSQRSAAHFQPNHDDKSALFFFRHFRMASMKWPFEAANEGSQHSSMIMHILLRALFILYIPPTVSYT